MEAKVIFLGSTNVGKTTILGTYIDGTFLRQTEPTIGIDKITIKHSPELTIQYWDTAGQEKYNSVNFTYIKMADGVVLVYDPSEGDDQLKENLNFWFKLIDNNSDILEKNEYLWLVGNNKKTETIDSEIEIKRMIKLFPNLNQKNIFVVNQLAEKGNEVIKSFFEAVGQQIKKGKKGTYNLQKESSDSNCSCYFHF